MEDEIKIVRLKNTDQPYVDWGYTLDYRDASATLATLDTTYMLKEKNGHLQDPTFLFSVPGDDAGIYMAGNFLANGAVMRFKKQTGEIDWYTHFS